MLALHFSNLKHCRLWVIISNPVLLMFMFLSQAQWWESQGGVRAWCPGKAAESDQEHAGVAEIFGFPCSTQPTHKGRTRPCCLYFSSCCPSEHPFACKHAHGLNISKLILSGTHTLPCLFRLLYGLCCSWTQSTGVGKNSDGNNLRKGWSQSSSASFCISS